MSELRRSVSSVSYGGYRDTFSSLSSPNPVNLRRVLSLSQIAGSKELPFTSYRYRDTPYYRSWEPYGGGWYDKRYYTSPVYWPYPSWRYRYLDPPESLFWTYPNLSWYPRTSRHAFFDMLNPNYWRRYSEPHYTRPLYYPYRPWVYEKMDIGRAMKLNQMNLISNQTLEKYWLAPRAWETRWSDYNPPYRNANWFTTPRRYAYSYPYYSYY